MILYRRHSITLVVVAYPVCFRSPYTLKGIIYTVWHNLNHNVILNTNTITRYQNRVMGLVFKLTLWIQCCISGYGSTV